MHGLLFVAVLTAALSIGNVASAEPSGRFQISATTDDWKRAWRIDTKTGEVSICSVAPDFTGCRKLAEGAPLAKSWRDSVGNDDEPR